MKNLLSGIFVLFVPSFSLAQPNLTLWIAPDGYHTEDNHSNSQQYFCDSSYYIFYHPNPDTLFITAKNEGTEPLAINSINTVAASGANFQVIGFSNQNLLPGEMYTIKLLYQLPSEYLNGINGQITVASNDPVEPSCTLYFDVGCGVEWALNPNSVMGVYGNCLEPVVYVREFAGLTNPNMLYSDSMSFYAFDGIDTSHRIMKLSDYGVVMRKDVLVYDRFYAGLTGNGSENAFNVDTSGVNVNRYLDVNAKLHVSDILDADNGITCAGPVNVTGNTNLDGTLEVTGDAAIHGTFEVDIMTSPSDSRLKKEINPMQESLSKIMMLNPKTYYLKDPAKSDRQQYGFLAQELEAVIPAVVHSDSEGMKSVNYLQIIPWLAAAIQEQQEEINQLKSEIAQLKK